MMRVSNTRPEGLARRKPRRNAMQARLNAQMSRHPVLVSTVSFIAVFAFYIVAGSAFA